MLQLLLLLAGIILVGFVGWFYLRKNLNESKQEIKRLEREKEELEKETQEETASSLEDYNKRKQKEINERKDKIIQKLKEKGYIKTGEVQGMFDVSRSSAYRYLSELEKEGKIKQTKKFGREVRYDFVKQ